MGCSGTIAVAGTVAGPNYDHGLYQEAQLVADGRTVHKLPSMMMLYAGLFENATYLGWTTQRVEQVEQCARDMRALIYETRKLKLLAQMRSLGYDC